MLGGDGKGADFAFLTDAVQKHVKTVIAYGRDQALIKNALSDVTDVQLANDFDDAFNLATKNASQGDAVLLSPACASFDMFKSFEHRGDCFVEQVNAL